MLLRILCLIREVDFLFRVGYKKNRNAETDRLKKAWDELKKLGDSYIDLDWIEEVDWKQAKEVFQKGKSVDLEGDFSKRYHPYKGREEGALYQNAKGRWFLKEDGEVIQLKKAEYAKYGIVDDE